MNKISNKRRGFSLLEMLVYIAILVLMLGVIINISVSVVRSQRAVKAAKNVENSAIVSLERITREVRGADSIDTANSVFDSNPGTLILNAQDDAGNPRIVEFSLTSNSVSLEENNVVIGSLSQPDAQVKSLIFHLVSNATTSGVRIEMTVESGTSTYYKSENFYSYANLR